MSNLPSLLGLSSNYWLEYLHLLSCHILYRSHYFPTFSPYPKFGPLNSLLIICITGQPSTWERNLASLSHFLVLSLPLAFSFSRHAFSSKLTFLKEQYIYLSTSSLSIYSLSSVLTCCPVTPPELLYLSHQNLWLSNPTITLQSIFYWIFFLHALLTISSLWNPYKVLIICESLLSLCSSLFLPVL